ncbi:galactokinase [Alkalicoccus luteus]|uniref:Galactokinase n=1 Tax=Alkalicoccus luteus TaxID=1237094 RepID=A0A969TWB3_9BACI|nr:galactokinase [Alkalicoccus luteus]NJP39280.1 galactokinase [Alkalicoccus luteus]
MSSVEQKFEELFRGKAEALYFSPGRVNLIGEHIDYNGGLVFPAALTIGTYAAVSPLEERKVEIYSVNFPEDGIQTIDLEKNKTLEGGWTDFVRAMTAVIERETGRRVKGFRAVVEGTIPNGAGLSSSASFNVLIGTVLNDQRELGLDQVTLSKLAQQAENDYLGVNCGIMDPFAIANGREKQAMLLDTRTLDVSYAPLELGDNVLVIMNTNKRRELADSAYNQRREECESALRHLQQEGKPAYLCEVPLEMLEEKAKLLSPVEYARTRHAITEQQRTKDAHAKLVNGDIAGFAKLLDASHRSLRDDYEVTGDHLDALVEAAWAEDTVLGARMTGAGFGGCAIAVVKKQGLQETLERLGRTYQTEVGWEPAFYVTDIGGGAGKWKGEA